MTQLSGKHILLIIGGGIAAYKALELVRLIRKADGSVDAILTRAGAEFVTPMSVTALTGAQVRTDLFDLGEEAEMGHIEASRAADLVVVAPATADLMAKLAGGLANDLASTTLLAADKPVLMAPAMNVAMWHHPATVRNLGILIADGVSFVGPGEGEMACGEFGPGRLAEPEEIFGAIIEALLPTPKPLAGARALVTSGPTHEPIDPVRYFANRSSGKQGHAIAAALAAAGAETYLVTGPVALADPPGVAVTHVQTARDMLAAVSASAKVDVAVFAAAVADWRTPDEADQKIKKGGKAKAGPPKIDLVENPDILAVVSSLSEDRPGLVIGFAAETENIISHAKAKRKRKGCDWMVANDVSPETGIMGGDRTRVHLITEAQAETWPEGTKTEIAARLVARIALALGGES
ncbi:Phosphopantothenoylcysteine decarboxylase / Phosphopantothenoylcysteine synthetase [hydrothermal vent metagenome]|uniref:Phosphopantothenoylcysteine decarboxylase / Phosphopantothenoylcysteine synthetase n=1 Tax=hydrothermal vent metagenome TaxID=652676 RepID=A0A3B0TT17_9ZZZZ